MSRQQLALLRNARDVAGVLLKDWWRYYRATSPSTSGVAETDSDWVSLCNRIERLDKNPTGRGVRCLWSLGSELHATGLLPGLGRRLIDVALRDWPIRFVDEPTSSKGPRISFLFAHGGVDRLPQLQWTLRSIFAQRDVQVECIVVDQTETPIGDQLPEAVQYVRLDKTGVTPGWYKSWAFNIAAKHATGEILVFQDGDVCAPEQYAAELCRLFARQACRAASIQRFLFYLDPLGTDRVYQSGEIPRRAQPTRIYQNWKGGTIAVERRAFFEIGGFDEGFVDWGGEDDEFYDRCRVVGHCRYGFLPFVHLFHKPQPDRMKPGNINTKLVLPGRLAIPPEVRIKELLSRGMGGPRGPVPRASYKSKFVG